MEKMRMESPNLTAQNVEKIAALFPNCITEAKDAQGNLKKAIDFDRLRQMLSNDIAEGEVYEFTWVGKKAAMVEANTPIRKTLRPCPEESKDWDTTQNLYIEGDNLDALKLLQESYLGKVKMIYIDPPYNTGKDSFVYPDNYAMDKNEYEVAIGLYDEDGNRLYKENNASNPRFHSDWCSMIYSRLLLARNLLSDDGVIFVSIDDHEDFNLKKICDEVFGISNFVVQLAVQLNPRGRNLDQFVAKTHESVFIYVKNYDNINSINGIEKEGKMLEEYNKEDDNGKYREIGLRNRNQSFNPQTRPNLYFPLYVNPETKKVSTIKDKNYTDEVWPDAPDGTKTCWTWMRDKVTKDNNLIIAERSGNEWRIFRKDYLINNDGSIATTLVKSLWVDKDINNDYGKKYIKELFGTNITTFPKSVDLLHRLIKIGCNKTDTIMDFFSGSATTAHAVMKLNAEDGGTRKFIMVQLPEPCTDDTDAAKAGYANICEIGKERIRRAGAKIKDEAGLLGDRLDIGFRVLKVADSNMKPVYYEPDKLSQGSLLDLESNIKKERNALDLLFGCLIEWGVPLDKDYHAEVIDGFTVHFYQGSNYVACFDSNVSEKLIEEIASRNPEHILFRDSCFASAPAKMNMFEVCKRFMPSKAAEIRRVVTVL